MKEKYTLVGVDGNAYAIMGYVVKCMRKEGFSKEEIDSYYKDATSNDYDHLLYVSVEMIEKCNNK